MFKKIPILSILFFLTMSIGHSQILTWDFNDGDISTDNSGNVNSNFNDLSLNIATLSRSTNVVAFANDNNNITTGWPLNLNDAVTNDHYLEFTINPNLQFEFGVSNIIIDFRRNATGVNNMILRSSVDGFTTNIDGIKVIPDITTLQTINFNVAQPSSATAITYRIYCSAENATNGRLIIGGGGDDIVVQGIVSSSITNCNISDDFSATTLTGWTDSSMGNAAILNNELVIATGGVNSLDFVFRDASADYNTILNNLSSISWEFNMRFSNQNPSGFNANRIGIAFILGATDSDISQGSGYAIVLGQTGDVDNVRLVRYENGLDLDSNLTNIVVDSADYGREYLSIKVSLNPNTNTWDLFVRNDGNNNFYSPITLNSTNLVGSSIDATHTGLPLNFTGPVFKHNVGVGPTATFDNICIAAIEDCSATTTWNGSSWNPTIPDEFTSAILEDDYTVDGTNPSFTACSLTINSGARLTIRNSFFVEVANDVLINDGEITTESNASFVQRGDGNLAGTFNILTGDAFVNKTTSQLTNWYDVTYWSSPVENESTDGALSPSNRVFWFDANNYLNNNDQVAWTREQGDIPMLPGQGFAASHNEMMFTSGIGYNYVFEGSYNTGNVSYPIFNDPSNILHWNLIGNPYPSAIDVDTFFTENGNAGSQVIYEAIYLWSQVNPIDAANPGNEVLNYNQNDYITINTIGEAGNGTTAAPLRQVPSGQAFFIPSRAAGNAVFTNSMRVSGNNANDQFFRTSSTQNTLNTIEKLHINLSSDIGIYSQICLAYADFATDGYDGNAIDTNRNYAGNAGLLYSMDNDGEGFYVIQGKSISSLTEDEVVKLGFGAYISTNETYTIEAISYEGSYLENNPIYIKDNDLGIVHDLTSSGYTFTSDGGNFEERFEIVFRNQALSIDDNQFSENDFVITEQEDDFVKFQLKSASTLIENIDIYDLQGRLIYSFEGNSSSEIYNLSNLNQQVFIVKAKLSNGITLTKKSIKR